MTRGRPPHTSALLLFLLSTLLAACSARPEPAATGAGEPPAAAPRISTGPLNDPHSYSEPDLVRVRHLALDLVVDFAARRISGRALLELDHAAAERLILDTRDLEIHGVFLGDGTPASFRLGLDRPHLGTPLIIDLPVGNGQVLIEYSTSPGATALQWLDPAQTAGGRQPFLFTQSQAILARTWVPIQDTPQVRFTYEATVRVPPGLLALMSAENPQEKSAEGLYRFRMLEAIPSYLLALAVGDLEFRPLGPITGVYAEPEVVEAAAWELADTQAMVEAVEALFGTYRWGRYDLLVLPPSFPYGGMENPRLTFLTPTILAGDRSLVALIAHELAHSWSGNLVTNATWNDFWLNEGFTTYLERRIMEALYGPERAEMLAELGLRDLRGTLEELDPSDQRLALELAGRDPDEGVTDVAYRKGALFLHMLERSFGRERWDAFLRGWFDEHAFTSATTRDFLDYLEARLLEPGDADRLQVARWVHGPGIPDNAPVASATALRRAEAELARWNAGAAAAELDTEGWVTQQWLHFLRDFPAGQAERRLAELDRAFALSESGNSEILFAWLMQAVAHDYRPAYPALEQFLTSMGRRKFLRPLYARLAETGQGRELALAIYERARPLYHPVSQATVDAVLGWGEER